MARRLKDRDTLIFHVDLQSSTPDVWKAVTFVFKMLDIDTVHGHGTICYDFSICSALDNFSRKMGVRIATGRLNAAIKEKLPYFLDNTDNPKAISTEISKVLLNAKPTPGWWTKNNSNKKYHQQKINCIPMEKFEVIGDTIMEWIESTNNATSEANS